MELCRIISYSLAALHVLALFSLIIRRV